MKRYLLFEYDHGGPNNIIIAFRLILFIAKFFDFILVLPPAQSIYHFDWGPCAENELDFESKTYLTDIINIPLKYIKIISFSEFCAIEKKHLPPNFANYNRLKTDYINMKIQSIRLSKKEPNNRGKYWHLKMLYLKEILNRNFKKSRLLGETNINELDYVEFIKQNKNFYSTQGLTDARFIKYISDVNNKYIYIPMDPFYLTKYAKYPRIFNFSNNFNPEKEEYLKEYRVNRLVNENVLYNTSKQIQIWKQIRKL